MGNCNAKPAEELSPDDGERVVGMGYSIGQMPSMVEDAAGFESAGMLASGVRACYDLIYSEIHSFFYSFRDWLSMKSEINFLFKELQNEPKIWPKVNM